MQTLTHSLSSYRWQEKKRTTWQAHIMPVKAKRCGIKFDPPSVILIYENEHTNKLRKRVIPVRSFSQYSGYRPSFLCLLILLDKHDEVIYLDKKNEKVFSFGSLLQTAAGPRRGWSITPDTALTWTRCHWSSWWGYTRCSGITCVASVWRRVWESSGALKHTRKISTSSVTKSWTGAKRKWTCCSSSTGGGKTTQTSYTTLRWSFLKTAHVTPVAGTSQMKSFEAQVAWPAHSSSVPGSITLISAYCVCEGSTGFSGFLSSPKNMPGGRQVVVSCMNNSKLVLKKTSKEDIYLGIYSICLC